MQRHPYLDLTRISINLSRVQCAHERALPQGCVSLKKVEIKDGQEQILGNIIAL
jgi:hypothetical protein